MRRIRRIATRLFGRRAGKRSETLGPFLSAVRPEAPPEGLLQRIESEIAVAGEMRPRRPRARLILALAVAAFVPVVIGVFPDFRAREQAMLDPAGRRVAAIVEGGSVRFTGPERGRETGMAWHLWGVANAGAAPASLGLLGDGDLVIDDPDRFSGYAMSLEKRDFSGASPTGPVIALSVGR